MKRTVVIYLLNALVALLLGSAAYAAPKLVKSTPEDGGVMDAAPSAFVLEFSEAVMLHDIYLKKDGGREKPVPGARGDAKTITIAAPPLAAGHYVLEWSVFTHDSRVLSGRVRFTVSADSATPPSASQ